MVRHSAQEPGPSGVATLVPVAVVVPTACLFCGLELDDDSRTMEHVFPKWLQQRCDIADETIVLANGTELKYARLLVPACGECNNIDGGHLEERVADGSASTQDMWIWMLKIQLGIYYWESGRPLERDRRLEGHDQPIFPLDAIDLAYFHTMFGALKGGGATFDPTPSGTLLAFDDPVGGFDYADRLFAHPRARDDVYSAGMIAFDGTVWIALFDDGRRVADSFIDVSIMEQQVQDGRNPRGFLPELMYTRSRILWHPKLLVATGSDGKTSHVVAAPTMGVPHIFDWDDAELATFYPPAPQAEP